MSVSPQRGDFGAERYEKKDFQEKVRESFLRLKAKDMGCAGAAPWHVINAAQSIDDLHAQIKALVERIEAEAADKPLQTLWA